VWVAWWILAVAALFVRLVGIVGSSRLDVPVMSCATGNI
jgi:hypothetical protein